MRQNVRLWIESVIVSAFLIVMFYIWQIVQGYMITKKIISSAVAPSVNTTFDLPSEVAFVYTNQVDWAVLLGCFLLLAVVYYGVRMVINRTGK
ncbi:hypothetical protein [Paenibacillus camelliae]|uniref:hypothetical protein n=1 Tax=Paenibacillus camelliae TaxID=512410 RepID=UPI0020408702|nr:hypothetical protein [Paenibacillus camelliae]MCM3633688.1 hypothetical protein [Paenibacillus camelliae]